jgi:hypothetical protein
VAAAVEEGWGARLRAGVVIGLGLLLAVAATLAPLPPAAGEPGASLAIRLPDMVRTLVVALLALSLLLLLGLQRPRRPTEEELQHAPVPQRRSTWAAVLVPLVPLALLALAWYLIVNRQEGNPIEVAFTTLAGLMDLLASARKAPTSVPLFDYTIATLALLAALAIFALMLLVALAGPLEKWWAARHAGGDAPAAAAAPPDLDDLRAVPDARAAVIRAYGRFELALAAAHHPRAPWQTPAEFRRAAVARLPLPALPVERLTGLFEVARFSQRPLGPEAREAACDCLDEITAALEPPDAR